LIGWLRPRTAVLRPQRSANRSVHTLPLGQGRYTDAVAAFEQSVELGANNHGNWGNLGDGLRWAPGRRAEAAVAYRRAVNLIQERWRRNRATWIWKHDVRCT